MFMDDRWWPQRFQWRDAHACHATLETLRPKTAPDGSPDGSRPQCREHRGPGRIRASPCPEDGDFWQTFLVLERTMVVLDAEKCSARVITLAFPV